MHTQSHLKVPNERGVADVPDSGYGLAAIFEIKEMLMSPSQSQGLPRVGTVADKTCSGPSLRIGNRRRPRYRPCSFHIEALEGRSVLNGVPVVPENWTAGHGVGSAYQLLADVNGDGRADAVAVHTSGSLAGNWYVALSNGSTFGGYSLWRAGHGAGASWVGAADVTGDGRADAVIAFTSGGLAGSWYVAASSGSAFSSPTAWQTGHGAGASSVGLGDVDADGRADAVAVFLSGTLAGSWYVARSQGNGFQTAGLWRTGLGSGANAARIGDVTGDGRADAIAVYTSGTLAGNWYVSPSNGSGFDNYSRWYEGHGAGAERVILADVNGDGRKDALVYFSASNYYGRWYVATSIGSTFVAASPFRSELAGTALAGDITGDGTDDPVTFSPADGAWKAKRSDWLYATTAVSTGGTRDLEFLAPAGTLVVPPLSIAVPVSSGTINAPTGSTLEITGGGTLQQSGAINAHALSISWGITSSSNDGLSLTGPGLAPTALLLTGSAVLTAPGGVSVSSVLGLSSETRVASGTAVLVADGGVVRGAGTVLDVLTVAGGGVLSPAADAVQSLPIGVLRVGRLGLGAHSEFQVDTAVTSMTVAHDQVIVSGPVSVGGSRLRLTNSGFWPTGAKVILLDNKSSAAVDGVFVNADGSAIQELSKIPAEATGAGLDLWLTYRGGDGNDVALMSNAAPTAVACTNVVGILPDSTSTATRIKLADIAVTDDIIGTNTVALTGADASFFEVSGSTLYLKAGVALSYWSKPSFTVALEASDSSVSGSTPVSASFTLQITNGGIDVSTGQTTTDPGSRAGPYQLVKKGGGTLILDRINTHTGGTIVDAGRLVVKSAAALGTGEVRVKAGASLVIDSAAGEVVAGSLVIDQGGFVDLGTGRIRINSGMTGSMLVASLLAAKGDGSWTGGGLGSSAAASAAAAVTIRTLGWLDNGDGSITVGYAAPGDTNLDAVVDVLDAANLVTNGWFNDTVRSGASWMDGDFNYDQLCDVLDLAEFGSTGLYNGPSYGGEVFSVAAKEPVLSVNDRAFAIFASGHERAVDEFDADVLKRGRRGLHRRPA